MTYAFHYEASAEFEGAVAYYEERGPGLGLDLALEVEAAIQNILALPKAWPILEGEIRRCLVRRFPYGILYAVETTEIWILAVMHLHRAPDYWKHRLQS
jgi:plasmid stabilization system protein ParE